MLYQRWQQIAAERRNDVAVTDLDSGQQWTFGEISSASEKREPESGPIIFTRGNSVEFVLTVLRAWRAGRVLCPLEMGQAQPQMPSPPSGCVHLKITSATMGKPRLVAFTARQLAADADQIIRTMGLRADWPNLQAISLSHSYGFSNLVLPLLLHGVPLILLSSPLPEVVRRAGTLAPGVTLPGVPALWRVWFEAGVIPANLRLAISAGAPLPLALEEAVFAATGVKIHNFYGSSECGGIAYDRGAKPRCEEGFAGTAMDQVQLEIAGNGCLEVRGPAVGETYWPEREATLANGRFETSDLAEIRQDRVYLLGRAGDVLHVAGRKVSPEGIERVLERHPAVRACLVFGIPSPSAARGDQVVAIVSLKTRAAEEDLREFLIEHLAAWQIPRRWWFVNSLTPNARGKVSRAEWRRRFLDREATRQAK